MTAISQSLGDSVDLFIPTDTNVANAFEGIEDMEGAQAINAARAALIKQRWLFARIVQQRRKKSAVVKVRNLKYAHISISFFYLLSYSYSKFLPIN